MFYKLPFSSATLLVNTRLHRQHFHLGRNMDVYTCSVTFVLALMIGANAIPQPKPEPTPCCLPEQFEADAGITQGVSVVVQGMPPHYSAQQAIMRLSVDYKNKRQAYSANFTSPTGNFKQRSIIDMVKKIQYIIEDEGRKCTKMVFAFDVVDNCLPDSARIPGTYYTGYGDSKQELKAYHFSTGSLNVTLGVTEKECYPVSQSMLGMFSAQLGIAQGLGYANIELGIKDPSVFVLPPSCNNATMAPNNIHHVTLFR